MKFKLNLLTMVPALITLSVAIPKLNQSLKSLESDKTFTASLSSAPHLQAAIADASQKWRTVESDEIAAARNLNIFSKISAVQRLLASAGVLVSSVVADQGDPAIVAEIAADPVLSAKLKGLLSNWNAVAGAFAKL